MKTVIIRETRHFEVDIDDNLESKNEILDESVKKIREGVPTDNVGEHKHDFEISSCQINKDVRFLISDLEYAGTVGVDTEKYVDPVVLASVTYQVAKELLEQELKKCGADADKLLKEKIWERIGELHKENQEFVKKLLESDEDK